MPIPFLRHTTAIVLFMSLASVVMSAPATAPASSPATQRAMSGPVDLSKQKTLYLVGYAHLDTQWRWAYPLVIREYLANTLRQNFELFEKYPDYVFNFSGSRRYEMMKEYYPKQYEKLKQYVAQGRWFPCGSSVDENDANVPSSESQIRHVLYGNEFFKREFGIESHEFMLPDCFGFPASLPTILVHCGIRGFSTQKLTWGSAVGIPFKVGVWQGVSGEGVLAALDPGSYSGGISEDLSHNESWLTRINNTGKISGVFADYHYYGTGDRGGAPDSKSVSWLEKSLAGDGPLRVLAATAERMFLDITDDHRQKLPKYQGELLLTEHSAGSITSQAYMKRWNRKNELLADAAERACVAAAWLGGAPYPATKLYNAWVLVLGSQMHDMLPGTSLPKCYEYCWNDELLALNQFAAAATDGVAVVASRMDTRANGVPVVVYNPLAVERQDMVEATVPLPAGTRAVNVFGPHGDAVLSQVTGADARGVHIAFLATAPSVGFVTYDVRPSDRATNQAVTAGSELKVDEGTLENHRFRVTINDAGDIASVFDKRHGRQVLASPSQLAFLYENPAQFPAWNMDWNDRTNLPRSYVAGGAKIRVVERGPARATIEVTRESEGSRFVQRISLAATGVGASKSDSAGDRIEVASTIDWQTTERSLKATFPLTVANPQATYQIGVGTVQRANNDPRKYEVPQHQWFDLTAADGRYGVAVLNDCKYGSDKPDDHTVRLTMLYTPGVRGGFRDQGTQDIGRHQILYAIAPHAGDWVDGGVQWAAQRLNQPLLAFLSPAHPGALGKSFSLLKLSTDQVGVDAIKKAQASDEIVVRLKELSGKPVDDVRISAAAPIASAHEVNGQEASIAPATLRDGAIVTELQPYHLRAFALKLSPPPAVATAQPPEVQAVALPYDTDAASSDDNRADGGFDRDGRTLAAEQLPATIASEGIEFKLGPTADGQDNAVVCKGQTISLPAVEFDHIYILAAAVDGDQDATFKIGDKAVEQRVQDWGGYIGQWDNRVWDRQTPETSTEVEGEWIGLEPGYVKRDTVAWFCSHRHHPTGGNEFYRYSYLFKYGFAVPAGATSITLPNNVSVRVFAMTVAKNPRDALAAAHPLFDTLEERSIDHAAASISPAGGSFNQLTQVTVNHPLYWQAGALRYTLDGSAPTTRSATYEKPIQLSSSARLRVVQFDESGRPGREASAEFIVNDTTAPTVKSVTAIAMLPNLRIDFSEPLRKDDAEKPENYRLDPPVAVTSARLSDDGLSVALTLAGPLRVPAGATNAYHLSMSDLRDLSPAANSISASPPVPVPLVRPVYSLDAMNCAGESKEFTVNDLPVKAGDHWTINLFVRADEQPENRTIIAGFGRAQDSGEGVGRYLCKFGSGVHFWSRRRDVSARRAPLDAKIWQMLTATYDGQTLRLYKNGRRVGQRQITLANDEPVVRIAPLDPWDQQRRFRGEIRGFTIWDTALPAEAIRLLQDSGAQEPATTSGTGQ